MKPIPSAFFSNLRINHLDRIPARTKPGNSKELINETMDGPEKWIDHMSADEGIPASLRYGANRLSGDPALAPK